MKNVSPKRNEIWLLNGADFHKSALIKVVYLVEKNSFDEISPKKNSTPEGEGTLTEKYQKSVRTWKCFLFWILRFFHLSKKVKYSKKKKQDIFKTFRFTVIRIEKSRRITVFWLRKNYNNKSTMFSFFWTCNLQYNL